MPDDADTRPPTFSVLRKGSLEPRTALSEDDLVDMLNNKQLAVDDLVFYEGIGEWKPIYEVFEIHEQISHFVDDGQDTEKVAQAFRAISSVISNDENIFYIAVQARVGLLSKAKQCVAITDRHMFIMLERRSRYELEAHPWSEVTNTLMRDEGRGLATFSVLLGGETRLDIAHIPLQQVQRLFQLSQEMKRLPAAAADTAVTDEVATLG